ncbi:hypothetical protein EGI22_17825 [Lacihabitans sp. LS3-19]|uniref:hypothetical protein n=1 Tax=Lacihabitans sp. LS3-19 TaxID=2487335 RepID=UPI0020CC8CFF|nr:hypothetical protein [Lacihabitans sp. LS3-19]MCP9769767.1 hypothetical protein [Lacihabitans sp. LS3-19]
MNTSFHAVMKKKSDKELISLVFVNSKDYQKEAVEAAQLELKTRNVSLVRKEEIITDAIEEAEFYEKKAELKLSLGWKILCFFLPGFITILIIIIDFSQGYDKRSMQAMTWTAWGVTFYFSLGFIGFLLDLNW